MSSKLEFGSAVEPRLERTYYYDRAQTIASLEHIKGIARNLKGTVIIQHDPRDIGKLPAFLEAAR